jgi:hypothetical protein
LEIKITGGLAKDGCTESVLDGAEDCTDVAVVEGLGAVVEGLDAVDEVCLSPLFSDGLACPFCVGADAEGGGFLVALLVVVVVGVADEVEAVVVEDGTAAGFDKLTLVAFEVTVSSFCLLPR